MCILNLKEVGGAIQNFNAQRHLQIVSLSRSSKVVFAGFDMPDRFKRETHRFTAVPLGVIPLYMNLRFPRVLLQVQRKCIP